MKLKETVFIFSHSKFFAYFDLNLRSWFRKSSQGMGTFILIQSGAKSSKKHFLHLEILTINIVIYNWSGPTESCYQHWYFAALWKVKKHKKFLTAHLKLLNVWVAVRRATEAAYVFSRSYHFLFKAFTDTVSPSQALRLVPEGLTLTSDNILFLQ